MKITVLAKFDFRLMKVCRIFLSLQSPVLCSLLLALLLVSACAPVPKAPERKRFFWPPATSQPKIEYINFYQKEEDARRGVKNWLEEVVLGKEKPHLLFDRINTIASDGRGRVIVSDFGKHKVFVFDLTRHEVRTLKTARGEEMMFELPSGIAVDNAGQVYVVDSTLQEVHLFGADERLKKSFGRQSLSRPTGLGVDNKRQRLYVVDTGAHRIVVFSAEGEFLFTLGERGAEAGQFNFPLDIDVDGEGNLFVLDSMNARIQVFSPEMAFLRAFGERGTSGGTFQVAKGIAVSPSGHIYVTDSRAHRFLIFDLEGNYLLSVGGKQPAINDKASPGGFYMPYGIDVDANDAIWVVDSLNRMFHQFQYLNPTYLAEHPILPGQSFLPPGFRRGNTGSGD